MRIIEKIKMSVAERVYADKVIIPSKAKRFLLSMFTVVAFVIAILGFYLLPNNFMPFGGWLVALGLTLVSLCIFYWGLCVEKKVMILLKKKRGGGVE